MSYLTLFLFSFITFAGVVRDEVTVTEKSSFPFKTVCQKMVSHESPLIEVVSGSVIDCMGKKVDAGDFCDKELAHDPYYLRGLVDEDSQKVICQSGKKVLFKYQCVKLSDAELCRAQAKPSCQVIQTKLARRLDLVHFSFTKNSVGIKELNCHFESLPLAERNDGSL